MIDSFLYYNETDLFLLRTQYLNRYVDKFVIVETDTTFSCQTHAAQFDAVYQQLPQEIKNKIVYHYLKIDKSQFLPGEVHYKDNSRYVEREMRNQLARMIRAESQDDWIMMSDLDEIWDVRRLDEAKALVDQHSKMFWAQDNRTAFIDWRMDYDRWPGTRFTRVDIMPDPIQKFYMQKKKTWGNFNNVYLKAGWHLTMMGDAQMKAAHIDSLREGPGWGDKLKKSSNEIAQGMMSGHYNKVVKKGAMRATKVGVEDLDPALISIAQQFPVLWSGALTPI
jgi:hypothetical protein